MSSSQYRLAGWISIVCAVVFVPNFVLGIVIAIISQRYPFVYIVDATSSIIICGLSVYLLLAFRTLLNERYNFHEVNNIITVSMWLLIAFTSVRLIDFVLPDYREYKITLGIIFFSILWVFGLVQIIYGVRLLKLKDDLFGMLKIYAYTSVTYGVCIVSLVLFPIGLLATVAGFIIEGIIFLRAAEDVEFV